MPLNSQYTHGTARQLSVRELNELRLSFPGLAEIQFADGITFDGTVQQIDFDTDSSRDAQNHAFCVQRPGYG